MEVAQADDLLSGAGHLLQDANPLVDHAQGPLGIGQELLSVDGQPDMAAVLLKEFDPQLLFQLLNGVAQAGLGDVELGGGLGVVHDAGQSFEVLKLQQCHSNPSTIHRKFLFLFYRKLFPLASQPIAQWTRAFFVQPD